MVLAFYLKFNFLWILVVHFLLLILFLPSDFLQSHHILAWVIWGFTGVTFKFLSYEEKRKKHQRAHTAAKHYPYVSQESALAHTGIVTGGTNPRVA